jgi:beta-galactosidase
MAHGGTNFGFYNGANTGQDESDYKPDLTSYDYASISPNSSSHLLIPFCMSTYLRDLFTGQDAPIKEHGDVHNAKYKGMLFCFFKHAGELHIFILWREKK